MQVPCLNRAFKTSQYRVGLSLSPSFYEISFMSKNSLKAAALAAAKVNAMLYAKGKLKLPDIQKNQPVHGVSDRLQDSLVTREYEINDVPAPARNLLTRGFVQDEICKYSGASISTRGRYLTFEERLSSNSKDRPLYLHIQGSSKESVNLAMARIQEMIGQFDKSFKPTSDLSETSARLPFNSGGMTSVPPSSGGHYVQDKVFVGLESSSSAFSVRERILGPGGSFLQHIKCESGATVTLRGRGSGYLEPTSGQEAFEPMYIHLTHPKPEGLQTAKTLALNLIDTVHAEYAVFQQQSEQALMPVSMGPHPGHLPFQTHVPGVSSVPTVLSHSLVPVATQGLVPVSSVQTMLGHTMTSPASQGIYTSNNGSSFSFQHATYVNTLSEVAALPPHPIPALHPMTSATPTVPVGQSVAMNPVTSLALTPGPGMAIGTVPLDVSAATSVPLRTVPSGLVAPVVTSMPMGTVASLPINPVTTMPLNTMPPIPMSMATSMHRSAGCITSVPVNLLPPGSTANSMGALPMEPAIAMGPPQMPMTQPMIHMGPPPIPQQTSYRELVGQTQGVVPPATPMAMLQQPLPPTTYTHLYLKQQQQQQMGVLPMTGPPPPQLQHGHKRKFREEGPDPCGPPPAPMASHPSYSLQAGASLPPAVSNGPPASTERLFLEPTCLPPPPVQQQQQQGQPVGTKRHMGAGPSWRDVDRNLMPPPDYRMMPPPPVVSPVSSASFSPNAVNRSATGDGEYKRFKGALSGLAALYNSDDSDEEAGSSTKSNSINNHK